MRPLPMGSTKCVGMNRPVRKFKAVHTTKGVIEVEGKSSFAAAKKAAKEWGLKSTSGIDVYLLDEEVVL